MKMTVSTIDQLPRVFVADGSRGADTATMLLISPVIPIVRSGPCDRRPPLIICRSWMESVKVGQ